MLSDSVEVSLLSEDSRHASFIYTSSVTKSVPKRAQPPGRTPESPEFNDRPSIRPATAALMNAWKALFQEVVCDRAALGKGSQSRKDGEAGKAAMSVRLCWITTRAFSRAASTSKARLDFKVCSLSTLKDGTVSFLRAALWV